MESLKKQWFLIALGAVCILGLAFPTFALGFKPLVPWLVALVMFLVGLGRPPRAFLAAVQKPQAIALTLFLSFGLMPVLAYLLASWVYADQPVLIVGMMILSAVPTTVASSVIWTRMSGGDDTLSVILVIASTVIGVLLLPFILELSVGRQLAISSTALLLQLLKVVLLPLLAAQGVRALAGPMDSLERRFFSVGHGVILLLVLTAVGESAAILTLPLMIGMTASTAALNLLASACSYAGASLLRFPRPERIAIMFAASQKTLTVGLLVGLMFFEGIAGLPVVVYHVVQQVSGYGLSRWFVREPSPEA
ncbi:MAG TPA: bile acid:sodium symporter [Acidobacteriota bacterium]|nr:bile acid:sodium symporter [Acidobacteriota bacterium]